MVKPSWIMSIVVCGAPKDTPHRRSGDSGLASMHICHFCRLWEENIAITTPQHMQVVRTLGEFYIQTV
ncbi:hypothetical protein BD310DRAFT_915411 [Dichomitus squalens]|uniref:Uncharacterized protein n=1 Tax=Dichomitus squalens TaxID=114155 RepID=A0A4Q9Q9C7_9APHY|nr:hypothetical protein BD310DRAFT_915411 [Dichomitus squalens]